MTPTPNPVVLTRGASWPLRFGSHKDNDFINSRTPRYCYYGYREENYAGLAVARSAQTAIYFCHPGLLVHLVVVLCLETIIIGLLSSASSGFPSLQLYAGCVFDVADAKSCVWFIATGVIKGRKWF